MQALKQKFSRPLVVGKNINKMHFGNSYNNKNEASGQEKFK